MSAYGDPTDRKDAEIAALQARCQEQDKQIADLEKKLDNSYWLWREEREIMKQLYSRGHVDIVQIGVATGRAREALEAIKRGD